MIERNKHRAGRVSNIVFGLCAVADGVVRVASLGFLHTTFPLDYARRQAKKVFEQMHKDQGK